MREGVAEISLLKRAKGLGGADQIFRSLQFPIQILKCATKIILLLSD
jgi:hypothetical protein